MAVKLFNYINQKLNAEKLREIEAFNSSNFGGIIGESSPFTVSGNTVTLTASQSSPITFLGGGLLLNQTETVSYTFSDNKLWYLEVILDSSVANITTDELIEVVDNNRISKISFKSVSCSSFNKNATYTYYSPIIEASGNPKLNQYYEYLDGTYTLSEDTSVNASKEYYYKIEATSITFTSSSLSTSSFTYFGNTLWISDNTFIIPLYAKVDGELIQTTIVRSLSDLEGLLSLSAYSHLKMFAEGTFVWSSGGREQVIDLNGSIHRKGDIGNLNITNDTIYNNTNYGTDLNPDYKDPVKINNLTVNKIANSSNDVDTKLVVDVNGNISAKTDYVQPINHGGTGATTRGPAKRNLGIFYGTKKPSEQPPTTSPQEGDIYLWIIE